MGVLKVRMGVLKLRMGVLKVRMGVLNVRMGVLKVRMGVLKVRMGVLRVRVIGGVVQDVVYRVCLETGDSGRDASHLFSNFPDLLGDRWASLSLLLSLSLSLSHPPSLTHLSLLSTNVTSLPLSSGLWDPTPSSPQTSHLFWRMLVVSVAMYWLLWTP